MKPKTRKKASKAKIALFLFSSLDLKKFLYIFFAGGKQTSETVSTEL